MFIRPKGEGLQGGCRAEAKPDPRPSFPLEVFAGHGEEIRAVLEWSAHMTAPADARRSNGDEPAFWHRELVPTGRHPTPYP
ncbi:hypothetical protein [Streptomyces sp. NPDC053720]|uniref:hypothetical protein n=1 Tax=Streptomyces sp. NPDC053720 TaxID=3154855 RepID=UPI0034390F5D